MGADVVGLFSHYGIYIQILIVVVTLFIALIIGWSLKRNNIEVPPVETSINGVHVGPMTYGEIETSTCINVREVDGDIVTFTTIESGVESECKQMEVSDFLKKFYYFPNGCDFRYKIIE